MWQTPETYAKMSPFNAADKIKKPLLLIHGEEDNNTGEWWRISWLGSVWGGLAGVLSTQH